MITIILEIQYSSLVTSILRISLSHLYYQSIYLIFNCTKYIYFFLHIIQLRYLHLFFIFMYLCKNNSFVQRKKANLFPKILTSALRKSHRRAFLNILLSFASIGELKKQGYRGWSIHQSCMSILLKKRQLSNYISFVLSAALKFFHINGMQFVFK